MLGIKGFQPLFLNTATDFIEVNRKHLSDLMDKSIDSYDVQWHRDRNEWNNDGPILLQIGGDQYEFTAFQLDDYSLTVNTINRSEKLDWYDSGDEMPIAWKKNPIEELNCILGKKIEEIYILEYSLISDLGEDEKKRSFFEELTETNFFLVGIEFKLSGMKECLHLANGLDCNAMKIYTTLNDVKNRRIKFHKH